VSRRHLGVPPSHAGQVKPGLRLRQCCRNRAGDTQDHLAAERACMWDTEHTNDRSGHKMTLAMRRLLSPWCVYGAFSRPAGPPTRRGIFFRSDWFGLVSRVAPGSECGDQADRFIGVLRILMNRGLAYPLFRERAMSDTTPDSEVQVLRVLLDDAHRRIRELQCRLENCADELIALRLNDRRDGIPRFVEHERRRGRPHLRRSS